MYPISNTSDISKHCFFHQNLPVFANILLIELSHSLVLSLTHINSVLHYVAEELGVVMLKYMRLENKNSVNRHKHFRLY